LLLFGIAFSFQQDKITPARPESRFTRRTARAP
jgi:hypothetical protein